MADLKIAGICFNKYGAKVAEKLDAVISAWKKENELDVQTSWFVRNAINPRHDMFTSLEIKTNDWTAERFKDTDVLIYICPSVQAVKHISGSISDQMSDPAVLVIDEKGEYCVPLLSGRRGEANDIGEMFARRADIKYINPLLDDPGSRFDIEEYALKTDMVISNSDYAKEITAAIESGHEVGFYTNYPVLGSIPDKLIWSSEAPLGIYVSPSYHTAYFDHTLWLIPRCLDIGVICGQEENYKTVRKAIMNALQSMSLYPEAVAKIATVKGCEASPALQGIALERDAPILSYDESELKKITGPDGEEMNAAEAAALKASEGKLIINTVEQDGVLIAVAMENIYIKF
jgi:cobalt-precorrin 5A hydrolase